MSPIRLGHIGLVHSTRRRDRNRYSRKTVRRWDRAAVSILPVVGVLFGMPNDSFDFSFTIYGGRGSGSGN